MKLSIVTGTRNRADSYRRFIASVERTVPDSIQYEVIVSEASDDPPGGSYAQPVRNICVLYERPRAGMVKGYNAAFRDAKGEYVVWFNDDAELLSGWAENALGFMREHPEVGMGCLFFLDHNGSKPDLGKPAEDVAKLKPAERAEFGWNTQFVTQTIYSLPYANFGIFPRELGERVGWFGDGFEIYAGDTSFSFSIIDAGYAVAGIRNARLLHYRARDSERNENRLNVGDDRRAFDAKWETKLNDLRAKHSRFAYLQTPKCIP